MTQMPTTTRTALAEVTELADDLADAQAEWVRAQADLMPKRDRAMLAAQQAGATYPELAKAAHVTPDRVKQILAAQRVLAADTTTS